MMYSDIKKKDAITCFDPMITEYGEETIIMHEGCLTWPGLWLKVSRPDHVSCTFEDELGVLHEVTMMGLECRIFQHEMDHMEGTNFTKRVSKLKLDMGKKRAAKMKKKSMNSKT